MIKEATISDYKLLAKMAIKLWPNHTIVELEEEFKEIIQDKNSKCFIKYVNDVAIGFAHCSKRFDYVEGTSTSPVGYLEGIYIEKDYRNHGFAKQLLLACEKYARESNCTEFASDIEIDNIDSYNFHIATGFIEKNRIICFSKKIDK